MQGLILTSSDQDFPKPCPRTPAEWDTVPVVNADPSTGSPLTPVESPATEPPSLQSATAAASDPPPPHDADGARAARPKPTLAERTTALVEIGLCSDVPTQMLSGLTLIALGLRPDGEDGRLQIGFLAPLLLLDSVLLVGLILLLLRLHGERPGPLLLGGRPWRPEVRLAIPVGAGALVTASVVLTAVRTVAPGLQTVERNPFGSLVGTPADATMFAFVGMIAGGVREEIQRAFVLHRFERYLGGPTLGLVVSSVAFGAGHMLQGVDTGITTAVLGALWGLLYLRRRSVVAPVLSHALFNTLQVGALFLASR